MTGYDVDAARKVLASRLPAGSAWAAWIDGALAELAGCVIETEGAVLTPEEAALVVKLIRLGFAGDGSDDLLASALAARLEAAQ